MVFDLMGQMSAVSFMPGPVPWPDLEGPASCAWHWPDAVDVLREHQTHMLVTVMDKETDVGTAIRLTLLTAAVVATCPEATGMYWGAGTTVSPAARFLDAARQMTPDELPLLSWLEFRVFPDEEQPDRWCLFTTGLAPLGLMEIEVRGSATQPDEPIDRVYGFAHYQAEHGRVLKDGDTIGASADERITIKHVPSAWDRPGPVLQLDL